MEVLLASKAELLETSSTPANNGDDGREANKALTSCHTLFLVRFSRRSCVPGKTARTDRTPTAAHIQKPSAY